MKKYAVTIALIIGIALADQCLPDCDIADGFTPMECAYYHNNDDWLPPNYVYAADCICKAPKLDYPAVNCVRKRLQQLHDWEFSAEFKQEARERLSEDDGTYKSWSATAFAPTVINIHHKAYTECCCAGTPAPDYMWEEIFKWPTKVPCSVLRLGQFMFSNCECHGEPFF